MSNEFPKASLAEYLAARAKSIDNFKSSVLGSNWRDEKEETVHFNPLFQYSCGVLYPRETKHTNLGLVSEEEIEEEVFEPTDEEENLEINSNDNSSADDENDEEERNVIDLSSQSRQSAFGLSFITTQGETIKVRYGFSTYEKAKKEDSAGTSLPTWNQHKVINEFQIENLNEDSNEERAVKENRKLQISIKSRKKDNLVISTLSMVHLGDKELDTECFFQVGLEVSTTDGFFQPIMTPLQSMGDAEAESLELLFRHKLSYSTGKGCATDWEIKRGKCKKLWTEFVPSYEVKNIEPAEGDFKMETLSDIDGKYDLEKRFKPIRTLISGYEDWIEKQRNLSSSELDETNQRAAKKHITQAEKYLLRIKEGYELIRTDEDVEDAFRLTNYSMLIQFNRIKNLSSKNPEEEIKGINDSISKTLKDNTHLDLPGVWRPFQLAFLLATIPEMVDPAKYQTEREEIDLIWFPTGGGKTEAYLAVLAMTIIYRRLMDPDDAGVTSIMRYTLRLLTSDQFRRSAALICALDFVRKEQILEKDLGKKPISLGLWIGGEASPKTHKNAAMMMKKENWDRKTRSYKFILHECPWCKSKLTNPKDDGYIQTKGQVIVSCSDKKCYFENQIPVYLWEEAVFDEKPTLLLATVDNFAKLAWKKEALNVFSNDQYSPPDLIIQDELHLISGPLGSLVGLYENVVLKLLTSEKSTPKIIGASATLTFSDLQSKSLYRGRTSSMFPPQVLDWGESYFASESKEKPGRMYVGYFGSSRGSMIESATSAAIPLLQAPQQMLPCLALKAKKGDKTIYVDSLGSLKEGNSFSIYHKKGKPEKYEITKITAVNNDFSVELKNPLSNEIDENETIFPEVTSLESSLDPYGTLVWYFNSKRELAYLSNQTQRMRDMLRTDARRFNFNKLGPLNALSRFSRNIGAAEELTGRLSQDAIENIVEKMNKPWSQTSYDEERFWFKGIDILFSTNMISVGVDIQRLGLMAIHGQPRTTAEYIQASSRVGRQHPGLVVTFYNHFKSKDRSIYEMFKNYHQSFYRFVESVSVTPFSDGSREKALPAIFIALMRALGKENPALLPQDEEKIESVKKWILESVEKVDPVELDATKTQLEEIIRKWKNREPEEWGKMGANQGEVTRLMDPYGSSSSSLTVFGAPISLRTADKEAQVKLPDGN